MLWDFGIRYASRVGGAGFRFRSPCLVVSVQDASGSSEGCIRSRWLRSISPTQIWVWLLRNAGFRVCGVRQNLHVYSLYRNPDLDDRIFDCLLASMAAVQAEDVRASYLFVGDLNGHHQELSGSTTTNRHGVAAFDFNCIAQFNAGCKSQDLLHWLRCQHATFGTPGQRTSCAATRGIFSSLLGTAKIEMQKDIK